MDNNINPLERANLYLLPELITLKGIYIHQEIRINGVRITPRKSLRVRNHSPTGFAWGYAGSGPAQLALAILLEYWSEELASAWYQDFKFKFIAMLPQADFVKEINLRAILTAIMNHEPIPQ